MNETETNHQDDILNVNNVEVVYNNVILALRGVSLDVPKGAVVSLLGANGAGKSTTLKACSRLLHAERGTINKGSITLDGRDIEGLDAHDLVKAGVIQVLEGRHVFGNLSAEENLLTGSFIRQLSGRDTKQALERVYERLPKIKERRTSHAALLSGGEQQMVAMGRALMGNPRVMLLDEPSMGLAPQLVEEIFEIVKTLNEQDHVSFLVAEQNMLALNYADFGYIIENGRVVMKDRAKDMIGNKEVEELYMGTGGGEDRQSFKDVKYYHRRNAAFG